MRDRDELNKFFDSQENFIVLSNAGKPIFALNGDIYGLSSVYATLYAMISKVQTFKFKSIDLSIQRPNPSSDPKQRAAGSLGMAFNDQLIVQSISDLQSDFETQ